MKCVNSLCMKQVNTAADVLYCPICQRDGTANEINPQRFPDIRDDMPIEEVLASHPGIAVRYQPGPSAPEPAVIEEAGDAYETRELGAQEEFVQQATLAEEQAIDAAATPAEESSHPDQAANPDSSPEQ